ncbi:hypothetical protein KC331_g7822 [Hortaea werneckii]|nr:hypothetical protein KC331_g7822 [Hortaea werneckii]KAI7718181.1 hypothetical protein KC353_g3972 [Hortaea werneckii]
MTETALAATQLVTFAFQTFKVCVDAYQFWHDAQRIGIDGDLLRTRLQYERGRLESWGERAGLTTSDTNLRLNWALIHEILQQQAVLLTSQERLSKKYGLKVSHDNAQHEPQAEETGHNLPENGIERVFAALRPELYTKTSRLIAAANGPIKRIQWAASGRDKVHRVISDLKSFNDDLERLLERDEREKIMLANRYLLQDLLSRSSSYSQVEQLKKWLSNENLETAGSIAAMAEFKRVRLYMGADRRSDEVQPRPSNSLRESMPKPDKLRPKNFQPSISRANVQIGLYKGASVMVEWRQRGELDFGRLANNTLYLAALLLKAPPSFAAFACRGYIADEVAQHIGLCYEIPVVQIFELPAQPELQVDVRNMADLLEIRRQAPLDSRLRIASTLAAAVLELHTAGWLHKGIRSENIVFVARDRLPPETFLDSQPYLIGYEYARPDNPDAANALTTVPNATLLSDLYRHPAKRGVLRTAFAKRHDLYALCCVLIELALWKPLVAIFSEHGDRDWTSAVAEADRDNQTLELPCLHDLVSSSGFRQAIMHSVGLKYLEAIDTCLEEIKESDEVVNASLDLERRVAESLRT